ncbi:synemin [Notechis scutatus]|uniref:Synemin n=1 Tax=Notechis scutatus TaxID=8663 RepID=A0A6J1UEY3_9SAUR|nr:synemin [Notechis scutatus]
MQRDEWDEQSELRELNARLALYVRQVRDLEQENGRLAHELAALRSREGRACRWQETEQEVAELRRVVADLSRAKGEAELERDALRQELESLERLSAQVGEMRLRRLEPELARQEQQLAGLWADCAALEALLEQLLAEHEGLQEARKQRPAALLPAPRVLRAGRVEKRQLESDYALVLSWSCAQSLERYEAELRALQELEGRLGHQDLRKLRDQNQESRLRLEELWRRCRELCALGERLEEEQLAQQERHGAELAEYQMIIEALQEEKNYLTMAIAGYLKDYHELLQVKASLSLEIETYRALLEAESNQWILMWNEERGRRFPPGGRNLRYEYSNRHSTYQQEKGKRALPAVPNVDLRYKFPQTGISRSAVSSSRRESAGRQTVLPEKKPLPKEPFRLGQRPSTATERYVTHERSLIGQRERQSFTSPYRMSREGDGQPRPERGTTEMGSMASALKESASLQKQTKRPMSSEGIRATMITSPPLSYSSTSSSKRSQYEMREGILGDTNKLIKEGKPRKEEKHVLVEGVEQKEKLANEATDSSMKNFEKLYGVEKTVQKKTETKEGMENKEDTVEDSIFKYKRKEEKLMKDKMPSRGWEEQIKVEAEGKTIPKGTATFEREKIVSTSSKSQETIEIPIHSGHTEGEILQKNHNIEITLQDFKTSAEKSKGEAEFKLSNEMTQGNKSKEENSERDASLTESIAENIISDILKGFVQKSSGEGLPPEAKIISFEKKEISEDGKVKTEISIQSTVQKDDLDVSNKSELGSFLEKDIKKVLEDTKGSLDENVLDSIINAGIKGMEDKANRTIKVEIIEEPATIVDERVEFSTPFEVEEAEDMFLNMREHPDYSDKEKATTGVAGDLKEKQLDVSRVEEVSEGDDVVDEEKYFVSTPDEYPFGYEEGEGSTYGQIHFEEESTVKYSWQDEFLEGSQTNIKEGLASPELIYQVMGADAGPFISKAEPPKEQLAHAESVVIEKEIRIPHEFQESIKEVFSHQSKDPKHQLKEALGKLEATLPELVKQELGELTKEDKTDSSTLEVDIKKVEQPEKEGVFTIVAEVNLSQTIDSDQLGTEWLGKAVTDQIKLSKQSPNESGFDQYIKQQPETWQDEKHHTDVSSTHWTMEETSKSEDAYPAKESFDINRHIRHVVVGPTEIRKTEHVFYEGPTLEFGTVDFTTGVSADAGQFLKEMKSSPQTTETTEKIIYRSPIYTFEEVSNPENSTQIQVSSDIRSSKHITLDSKQTVEEITFEGASELSSDNRRDIFSQMKDPTAISTSIRHIQIDPKKIHVEREIYEVPFSPGDHGLFEEAVKKMTFGQKDTPTSDQNIYEGSFTKTSDDGSVKLGEDVNTTIRHIKLSPKEVVSEQIVFTEPVSEQHQKVSELGQMFSSEGSVHRIKLGQKEVQSHDFMSQDIVLESPGISSSQEDTLEKTSPAETSRSTHHIQIGQGLRSPDAQLFSGMEFSHTDGPSENSKSVGQIRIGQKETSFTFQMDISKTGGREPQATLVVSSRQEAGNGQPEGGMEELWENPESEQTSEESTFDRTVQLQRMVDQRSVISDEKKIALLYLNENEGEEEDEGPWF